MSKVNLYCQISVAWVFSIAHNWAALTWCKWCAWNRRDTSRGCIHDYDLGNPLNISASWIEEPSETMRVPSWYRTCDLCPRQQYFLCYTADISTININRVRVGVSLSETNNHTMRNVICSFYYNCLLQMEMMHYTVSCKALLDSLANTHRSRKRGFLQSSMCVTAGRAMKLRGLLALCLRGKSIW